METLNDFRRNLFNDAQARAVAEGEYQQEAFLSLVLDRLVESGELESYTLCHFRGRGLRQRSLAVDAYDLSGDDDTVSLVVLDFDPGPEATTRTWSQVTKQLGALRAFVEEAVRGSALDDLEPSSAVFGLVSSLRRREVPLARVNLYYLTDGEITNRVREFVMPEVGGAHVEWRAYDMARLFHAESSGSEREPIEIDLESRAAGGLPCLPLPDGHGTSTFLVAVPGTLLADLYHEHGTRLLESNVRAYLSGRRKVNRGIRDTLLNEPDKFLPYNNGITATASEVVAERTPNGFSITRLTDLQVVNGGQTTASLFYSRRDYKADLSNVWVQMKLVEVQAKAAEELVPKIARFANTQNPVNETDFFANHPFHQRLEQLGVQTLVPAAAGSVVATHWYYERTRGSWDNERSRAKTKSAQAAFEAKFPRRQLITKTDAAKYLVSWDGKPQVVSQGAQKNFIEFAKHAEKLWEAGESRVNSEYYKDLVAKAILFQSVRSKVSQAPWYDKGYLANIVTYTIAALTHFFRKQFRQEIDLATVWRTQAVPEELLDAAIDLAEGVFEVLTHPNRPVANVTEWAKREACWEQVKKLSVELPSDLARFGLSTGVKASRVREAATIQRTDTQLLDEMSMISKPPEFWAKLEEFGTKNRMLPSRERSILSMIRNGRVPSQAQLKVLSRLVHEAESRGFHKDE